MHDATISESEVTTRLGRYRLGEISATGWRQVSRRVLTEINDDRIPMIAAGVAFYAFLAIFPSLSALISVWGLIAVPQQIPDQVDRLGWALPRGAEELLISAAEHIASTSPTSLGIGVLVSIALALWSANKGMKGLVEGINIAYNLPNERGIIATNGLSLALTAGAIVLTMVALGAVLVLPIAIALVGLPRALGGTLLWIRWPILGLAVIFGLTMCYRLAPYRKNPSWTWAIPGALIATALWIAGSFLFSLYVQSFGSFHEMYGSVSAAVVLLMWFLMSAFAVLLGAEFNAEAERYAARRHRTHTRS